MTGLPIAQGEALEFRWFSADTLPPADRFGFGQRAVVAALLERL